MTRHVSAEKLARFREADLRRAAARRVAAHLAGCRACQSESDALAQVPGLLAGTRVPPIPAHLAARIETALATESAHRAAARPAAPARRAAPRRPARGSAGPGHRAVTRRSMATAAVVVIAGGLGYGLVHASTGGSDSAASRPAGTSAGRALHSPAFGAAAPSAGARHPASGEAPEAPQVRGTPVLAPEQLYRSGGHTGTFIPVRSATDYLPAQLAQQVTATLAAVRGAARTETPVPGTAPQSRLAGCVGRIAGGHDVLLVDLASYQGSPATIIVTGAPGAKQAWVVGAGCSATASDVLTRQAVP